MRWSRCAGVGDCRGRDGQADGAEDVPRLGQMCWPGGRTATLLYWQSEPWVRMRDMPVVMAGEMAEPGALVKRKVSWRECAAGIADAWDVGMEAVCTYASRMNPLLQVQLRTQ
ncbi:hypothetical protein D3C76_1517820 [compost metagenome]